MNPAKLEKFLTFAIGKTRPVLVTGKPGIGKSDIMESATAAAGAELVISHPVVSDPTDYKGMPFVTNGEAHFLPFNDLNKLIHATAPLVFFMDDLGQASPAVQAACMQLILARRINGFKVSEFVTFMAATNRKQDRAGVTGILEPVKSRFASIVELEVSLDDWCKWALGKGNMPIELISFMRFRPELLNDAVPSKEMVNTASPRTIAAVGKWQNDGIPADLMYSAFEGAAGQGFATEYKAFLDIFRSLPNVDQIFISPDSVAVPVDPAVLYALTAAIAQRVNGVNADNAFKYIGKLPLEIQIACVKNMAESKAEVLNSRGFVDWASANGNILFNV